MTAGTLRQVAVARLSPQQELTYLARGAATIVIAVWVYLAAALGGNADARRALLPYQTLAERLQPIGQRMFRELQEGLLEAEAERSTKGAWPTPASLAEAGIPPFAFDPTARGAGYHWSLLRAGTYVNYLGVPDQPDAPAWLLLVQEPEPGVPPDQAFEDEEHHRLLDGTMLHVSTWSHASGASRAQRVASVPQAEGWQQVYAVGPGKGTPLAIMPK